MRVASDALVECDGMAFALRERHGHRPLCVHMGTHVKWVPRVNCLQGAKLGLRLHWGGWAAKAAEAAVAVAAACTILPPQLCVNRRLQSHLVCLEKVELCAAAAVKPRGDVVCHVAVVGLIIGRILHCDDVHACKAPARHATHVDRKRQRVVGKV